MTLALAGLLADFPNLLGKPRESTENQCGNPDAEQSTINASNHKVYLHSCPPTYTSSSSHPQWTHRGYPPQSAK